MNFDRGHLKLSTHHRQDLTVAARTGEDNRRGTVPLDFPLVVLVIVVVIVAVVQREETEQVGILHVRWDEKIVLVQFLYRLMAARRVRVSFEEVFHLQEVSIEDEGFSFGQRLNLFNRVGDRGTEQECLPLFR